MCLCLRRQILLQSVSVCVDRVMFLCLFFNSRLLLITSHSVLQPGMLLFDSHFECGNLHSAYLVTSNRDSDRASHSHTFYDLYMNEDVTTSAGAQWFYFSVSGNKAKQKVTFSIRNFYKQDSLFNEGMRPLVLSLKGRTTKSGEKRNGWTRYVTMRIPFFINICLILYCSLIS
jgi:hypothetical protein